MSLDDCDLDIATVDNLVAIDIYQPLRPHLDEFRLLTLFPGRLEEPLKCTLRRVSLDVISPPHYETISYSWGKAVKEPWGSIRPRGHIIVNGRPFNVPASAEAALRSVRLQTESRSLWLDSVCINQTNVAERGHQVSRIGTIYRMGRGNLIHLGGPQPHVPIEELDAVLEQARDHFREGKSRASALLEATPEPSIEKVFTSTLQAVQTPLDLVSRPKQKSSRAEHLGRDTSLLRSIVLDRFGHLLASDWFQRLWVVQEASLSRSNTCYWGQDSFPLSKVLDLFTLCRRITFTGFKHKNGKVLTYLRQFIQTDFEIRSLGMRPQILLNDAHLASYIKLSQYLTCTDPRDHVYSILAMFQLQFGIARLPANLAPDYTISADDVYCNMTRFMLSQPRGCRILDLVNPDVRTKERDRVECSWLVRFETKGSSGYPPRSKGFSSGRPSNHRQQMKLKIAPGTVSNILRLEGYILASVIKRLSPCNHRKSDQLDAWIRPVVHQLDELLMDKCRDEVYPMIDRTSLKALMLTEGFITEMFTHYKDRTYTTGFASHAEYTLAYKDFTHWLEKTCEDNGPEIDMSVPNVTKDTARALRFLDTSFAAIEGKRLFALGRGHIGWGPQAMRNGDVVAVIHGAYYPYLLRPVDRGYKLLGCVYVAGIMHSESFNMGLEKTWIDLC